MPNSETKQCLQVPRRSRVWTAKLISGRGCGEKDELIADFKRSVIFHETLLKLTTPVVPFPSCVTTKNFNS